MAIGTIGVVSTGAMGSALGRVWLAGGTRVVTTLAGRSARTARLAAQAGVEVLDSLEDVAESADAVVSVGPPGEAASIAAAVGLAARARGARPLLADLNAVAPRTVRDLAGPLDLIDGSISGPPPLEPGTTTLYLSGLRADELAAVPAPGLDVRVVGAELGLASAVKMSTASVYKGTVALLAHALVAAHANGVLDHVLDDLRGSYPQLVSRPGPVLARAAAKAPRYVAEMHEIAAAQRDAGLTPELFEAMAAVYEALARSELGGRPPEELSDARLDEVLAALSTAGADRAHAAATPRTPSAGQEPALGLRGRLFGRGRDG